MDDDWKKKPPSSSGGGYRPLHELESKKQEAKEETTKERAARQYRERQEELRCTASDEARWARDHERALAERCELGKRDTSHINFFLKVKKTEVPKFDLDEVLATPELGAIKPTNIDPVSMLADDIEALAKEGAEFVKNPTLVGAASMAVIAIPGKIAEFGNSVTKDYKQTFFNQYPTLEGKVIVHHAVEQQVQRRYPGLVSDSELHSLENLRGIPKEKNNELHLSKIRKEWNRFYKTNPNPSKEDLLKKATEIDLKLGGEFKPPIGD